MDGYINVDVERAKKLANDVLIGVKEKREKLYQKSIKKERTRRTQYNCYWFRKFDKKHLIIDSNEIEKYLEEKYNSIKVDRFGFFTYPDGFEYKWKYVSTEIMAENIIKLCKVPPSDGCINLDNQTALCLLSWEHVEV